MNAGSLKKEEEDVGWHALLGAHTGADPAHLYKGILLTLPGSMESSR